MALYFQRDALVQIYPNKGDGTAWATGDRCFRVPVLEGFSFSQTTNASEITLAEMQDSAGQSRRGRKSFNDSLAPVDWSFSTYLRPFLSSASGAAGRYGAAGQHVVDEPLWNALLAKSRIDEGTDAGAVASVTITNAGSSYSSVPTVGFSGGGGTGAAATAVLTSGAITEIQVTQGGVGYTSAPTVAITGGGGSSGAGTAVITGEEQDAIEYRGATATSYLEMNSERSNKAALNTFTLEVKMGDDLVYALTKCVVNSASISFDVDGIATVEWSGQADAVAETSATFPVTFASSYGSAVGEFTTSGAATNLTITEGGTAADTGNFIRNRLTAMTVAAVDGGASDIATFQTSGDPTEYSITLTGGSFSIDNGITFLVPEELGVINKPIEHVTGPRNVTGSWTCYLAAGTAGSKAFFNDLASTAGLAVVTHDFDVTFQVGGTSAAQPRTYIRFPHAHIEIPSHSVEDVISLETNFSALQSDLESNTPDDMEVKFYGV